MGVSLAKTAPASAPVSRSVSLEKFTPGRLALAEAVAEHGAGVKFVAVRHVVGWSCLDVSAEVLYGGAGLLITGGLSGAQYANAWAVIDGMMSRGIGHFAVVTQSPSDALTIVRYVVREGRVYSAADWVEEQYGPAEGETLTGAGLQAYEAASLDRWEKDSAHLHHVAKILEDRREERRQMRERAAARLASATQAPPA
ncbi:hypothetical protein [Streptomyces violaceusniger]|uniref:Uncharacterized protein n=1 Tax=Streptomyces violaceusniger (strain Tu 4113) TaxID=653045 RepID=G2PHP3_STRV4|nr:hypothetical protein [Streptomyces violaceusniger]AEM88844.1 hypothetical protein Strvi_0068 [Streptomyces violaceusniger Tu 4113]